MEVRKAPARKPPLISYNEYTRMRNIAVEYDRLAEALCLAHRDGDALNRLNELRRKIQREDERTSFGILGMGD